MEIYLAQTQGFCAGVAYAIDIVETALKKYGTPLYVYHEIVHNNFVVDDFRRRGIIFVEELDNVPDGSRIIFSAHGVPPHILKAAREKGLLFIDATCPLVTKVHKEAVRYSDRKCEVILIGHKGHQEIFGTAGYVDPKYLHIVDNEKDIENLEIDKDADVAYITQTTLSVSETQGMIAKLKERFSNLAAPPRADICYATQNRQDAVKELAKICDIIIVCGSSTSSNSNRLRETGQAQGVDSYIVDTADELDLNWMKAKARVGVSSGASVPRCIVENLVSKIKKVFPDARVNEFENPEKNIVFPLPPI